MTILQKFFHAIIITLFAIIWLLPKPIQQLLALIFYVLVAHVIGYRKKVILTNLRNSFPEKSEKEIRKIARKYYLHLTYMVIEAVNLRFSSKKRIAKCLTVENPEIVRGLRAKDRRMLVVLGHYGNWEFGSARMNEFDYRTAAIYKKLSSPIFEKFYQDMRQNLGVEPVEMKSTLRKLVEMRNSEKPFALLSVADQTPTKSNIHHWLTFLNQDTGVFLGPEQLAKKFDMSVIYCEIKRIGFCKFVAHVDLIAEDPNNTAEFEIIEKFYKHLEESIRRSPENWVWSHRRWKHKREPQA